MVYSSRITLQVPTIPLAEPVSVPSLSQEQKVMAAMTAITNPDNRLTMLMVRTIFRKTH